eukprot:scaffold5161_cov125-Isochrysis_galbana.AAC.2
MEMEKTADATAERVCVHTANAGLHACRVPHQDQPRQRAATGPRFSAATGQLAPPSRRCLDYFQLKIEAGCVPATAATGCRASSRRRQFSADISVGMFTWLTLDSLNARIGQPALSVLSSQGAVCGGMSYIFQWRADAVSGCGRANLGHRDPALRQRGEHSPLARGVQHLCSHCRRFRAGVEEEQSRGALSASTRHGRKVEVHSTAIIAFIARVRHGLSPG